MIFLVTLYRIRHININNTSSLGSCQHLSTFPMSSTSNDESDNSDPVLQQFYHWESDALIIGDIPACITQTIKAQYEQWLDNSISLISMFDMADLQAVVEVLWDNVKSHVTLIPARSPTATYPCQDAAGKCCANCYNSYRLHTNSSLFSSHTYPTLFHISHTCDSSFPHLLHPVSYFSHLWLIVPTLTPPCFIFPTLMTHCSHTDSTMTRPPLLCLYYIYG